MRLFHSPTSPYVRKVMVGLHETGQLADFELVPAAGLPTQTVTTSGSGNPLGKVPSLERPDGPNIYDSRVICQFIDQRAGAGLYPEPPRRWDTLTLEATGDGILDAALLIVYEARVRPEAARSSDWVEGQWFKIDRAVTALNDIWISHLLGRLDFGLIATGCALGYLDLRHDARNWRGGRPDLAAWYESFSQRPSMRATQPPKG